MFELFGILMLTVVAPLWIIFHYVAKMKSARALSTEDQKLLQDAWETSRRMEERIHTLERILDADVPGWRKSQDAQPDHNNPNQWH